MNTLSHWINMFLALTPFAQSVILICTFGAVLSVGFVIAYPYVIDDDEIDYPPRRKLRVHDEHEDAAIG